MLAFDSKSSGVDLLGRELGLCMASVGPGDLDHLVDCNPCISEQIITGLWKDWFIECRRWGRCKLEIHVCVVINKLKGSGTNNLLRSFQGEIIISLKGFNMNDFSCLMKPSHESPNYIKFSITVHYNGSIIDWLKQKCISSVSLA